MLLRITDRHLSLPHAFPWTAHQAIAVEADRGHHGLHLWSFELLAQVVDQIDKAFFVGLLGGTAVLVALEPAEADDLVALPLVAGHHLVDVRKSFMHALDHGAVFIAFVFVIGNLAAGWRAEIMLQRAVALRRLDQEHLFVMEGAHDITKADLRPDGIALRQAFLVRLRAHRRALATFDEAGFLKINIVAHGPVSLIVDEVGKLPVLLGQGDEVAFADEIDLFQP